MQWHVEIGLALIFNEVPERIRNDPELFPPSEIISFCKFLPLINSTDSVLQGKNLISCNTLTNLVFLSRI